MSAKRGPLVREMLERRDYAIIGDIIEPRSRVLDLGCGNGALLEWLSKNKQVDARGVEIDGALVQQAIAGGASAYQGDIAQCLADYPDQAFDYVILTQTLQQVEQPLKILHDMLRVGRKMIVGFPNFAHWSVRWSLLRDGRAPRTALFPYEWHESPNIHVLTVRDFEDLVVKERWYVEHRIFLNGQHNVSLAPNLRAEVALFVVRR